MTLEECYQLFDSFEPDEYGCLYRPGTSPWDYWRVTINGTYHRANRVALERKIGRKLGPGELALHSCDTPACVNTEHLRVGTDADNYRDRLERNPETRAQLERIHAMPRTEKQLTHAKESVRKLHKMPRTEKQRAQFEALREEGAKLGPKKLREKRAAELAERTRWVEDWEKKQK